MRKTILEIYALAVCFLALACLVVLLGFAIWNFIGLTAPSFTINQQQYECHLSEQAYEDCISVEYLYSRQFNPKPVPQGAALSAARQASYADLLRSEQRQSLQGLTMQLAMLAIVSLAFLAHWRLARRCRNSAAGPAKDPETGALPL